MTCLKCGKRASFLSPIGVLCPTDALLAAAFHDWIPEPLAGYADTSWLSTLDQINPSSHRSEPRPLDGPS